MQLEMTARSAATLIVRLSASKLSPVAKAAQKHEAGVERLTIAAVRAARSNVPMDALEDVLALGHTGAGAPLYIVEPAIQTIYDELFGEMTDEQIGDASHRTFLRELKAPKKKLPKSLADANVDGAKAAMQVKWTAEIAFDLVNAEAVAWAEQHAAELVTNIASDARLAIREVVSQALDVGITVRDQAKLIRTAIGLTERDAGAVMKQQLADIASGMSSARATERAERYADKLLRARAKTIARTETMRAANEGQAQLWRQARSKGLLSATAQKVWIAYDPCPICAGLSGETVPIDGEFSNGSDGPPAHPNCRCVTGLA